MATEYSYTKDPLLGATVAGRTLDEQIEHVNNFGNHGLVTVLRAGVLKSIGLKPPKASAPNVLMFGCYPPFTYTEQLRDYIQLLNILGVDYTYLEKEVCCGSPMIQSNEGEERERAKKAGAGFARTNAENAKKKSAARMAYFCIGCAHIIPGLLREERERHVYCLDLLIDALRETGR